MDNPKCPYCGEETLLVGSKAYGWHYICNCGAASPVASNPDEAYAAAMKRDRAKGEWRIGCAGGDAWADCPCCSNYVRLTCEGITLFDSLNGLPDFCPNCGADMRKEVNDER